MELQEKEAQKDYSIKEITLERTYGQRMSVNSRLKATKIIGHMKALKRQRIPEPSCAINILVTSRNGDRKIM